LVNKIEGEVTPSSHAIQIYFPPVFGINDLKNAEEVFTKFMKYLEGLPKVLQRNLGQLEIFKEAFCFCRGI